MLENISIIAWITLALISVESYLRANKVWKRKHKKDVAESISLMAQGVSLITLSFFITSSYIDGSFNGLISSAIWLSMTIFMILVGSGFWVTDIRSSNFWKKLKLYLLKESSELGNLANAFSHPNEREHIREIILKVALMDNEISQNEQKILETVLSSWDDSIDCKALEEYTQQNTNTNTQHILSELSQLLEHYLSTSPAVDQVSKLADLIQLLIHNNDKQTEHQKLLIGELLEQLNAYITDNNNCKRFNVVVIPCKPENFQEIKEAYPDLIPQKNGLQNYLIQTGFHTERMAKIYQENYGKLSCTSFVTIQTNN